MHRTLKDVFDNEIGCSFHFFGAIAYIIHLNRKYMSEEEIGWDEIHKFYDAKRAILEQDRFNYPIYSKERKRAERKYRSVEQAFRDTDPTRDIPF